MNKKETLKIMEEILKKYEFKKVGIGYILEDNSLKITGICEFEPKDVSILYVITDCDKQTEKELRENIIEALYSIRQKFYDYVFYNLGYRFHRRA